jgi:hypothetical protein
MGTLVLAEGEVSTLVSTDWYDDGPVDLTKQFDFLADNSQFRQGLKELRPDEFVQAIEEVIAPLSLNELTLPLFINLPELDNRPELVDALFPTVVRSEHLSMDSEIRMTNLLVDAGRVRKAERLGSRLVNGTLSEFRTQGFWDWDIVEVLSRIDPASVLMVLRETREKRVR